MSKARKTQLTISPRTATAAVVRLTELSKNLSEVRKALFLSSKTAHLDVKLTDVRLYIMSQLSHAKQMQKAIKDKKFEVRYEQ